MCDHNVDWEVNEMNEAQWVATFNGQNPHSFTAKELKEKCRKKGLKVGGNKSQLIARLWKTCDAKLMIGCEFVDYFRSFGPNEVYIVPVQSLKEVGPVEELLIVNYLLYK